VTDTVPVVLIPGLGDSGPEHWQTRWQRELPNSRRVVQKDWDAPDLDDWVASLDGTLGAIGAPAVLVAHSLACALVAHWAQRHRRPVAGALLVSPSDVDSAAHTPPEVRGFSPLPLAHLPFPSVVAFSRTDPYVDPARASLFAERWGGRAVDLGDAGHVNTQSGHGAWPEGRALLEELSREIGSAR
jgi:predicted alpha/beta hydrolase family esterase